MGERDHCKMTTWFEQKGRRFLQKKWRKKKGFRGFKKGTKGTEQGNRKRAYMLMEQTKKIRSVGLQNKHVQAIAYTKAIDLYTLLKLSLQLNVIILEFATNKMD